jgi:hypothetical protein
MFYSKSTPNVNRLIKRSIGGFKKSYKFAVVLILKTKSI